ncbi:MAG: hypothetical protein J7641_20900 [Cyanobacteria bacterium SID2]|nr:hypothetical protein [Cyanobacteria bacterium SID2]MBP0006437.1 hypothetical protein [Cyanobacteria bacterium SBC]
MKGAISTGRPGDLSRDILTDGDGADTFVLGEGDGSDVITDFTPGTDLIDLGVYNEIESIETATENLDRHLRVGRCRFCMGR